MSEHGIYYLVLCPYDIQFNQESHLNNKKYFNNIIKLNNKKMITTKRKKKMILSYMTNAHCVIPKLYQKQQQQNLYSKIWAW